MHPYLSLGMREIDPPMADLPNLIQRELDQIETQGLLVPEISKANQPIPVPNLVWEKGPIDVDRVQKFWPTAPAHGEPGGSDGKLRLGPWHRNVLLMISGLVHESAN
jgi:lariat debranching enzyme